MAWFSVIVWAVFCLIYVYGFFSLWHWGRHLNNCRKMMTEAAKDLDRREKEFASTQQMFVLGIHRAREIREARIEEARRN